MISEDINSQITKREEIIK